MLGRSQIANRKKLYIYMLGPCLLAKKKSQNRLDERCIFFRWARICHFKSPIFDLFFNYSAHVVDFAIFFFASKQGPSIYIYNFLRFAICERPNIYIYSIARKILVCKYSAIFATLQASGSKLGFWGGGQTGAQSGLRSLANAGRTPSGRCFAPALALVVL